MPCKNMIFFLETSMAGEERDWGEWEQMYVEHVKLDVIQPIEFTLYLRSPRR